MARGPIRGWRSFAWRPDEGAPSSRRVGRSSSCLAEDDRVVAASRRARELIGGLEEGVAAPAALLRSAPLSIPYEVNGRRETILYARDSGDMAAYEELRPGFTAAVSHELRTPLYRVLALLETATLPGADVMELVEQSKEGEVDQIRELIDDILFLSELESGHEVVGLGTTPVLPILIEVAESLEEQAARAGVVIEVEASEGRRTAHAPAHDPRGRSESRLRTPFATRAPARSSD